MFCDVVQRPHREVGLVRETLEAQPARRAQLVNPGEEQGCDRLLLCVLGPLPLQRQLPFAYLPSRCAAREADSRGELIDRAPL